MPPGVRRISISLHAAPSSAARQAPSAASGTGTKARGCGCAISSRRAFSRARAAGFSGRGSLCTPGSTKKRASTCA